MTSSPPQNSDEQSGLLKILASVFFGVLFGLFLSKLDTPTEDDGGSVHPKNNPGPETTLGRLQIPVTPQAPPPATMHYYPDRQKDNTPRWKKRTEIVAVCIAGGLLIVNIFVTVGTWKAANAAKDTNESAEKSFRISNRAYVTVISEPGRFQTDSQIPMVGVTLMSAGNTPAFNARRSIAWDVRKLPLPASDVDYLGDPTYRTEKFSFQHPETESLTTEINLSNSQRIQLGTQGYGVVLWGTVEYSTFKEIHHTRFCWVMRNDLKSASQRCPVHANAD